MSNNNSNNTNRRARRKRNSLSLAADDEEDEHTHDSTSDLSPNPWSSQGTQPMPSENFDSSASKRIAPPPVQYSQQPKQQLAQHSQQQAQPKQHSQQLAQHSQQQQQSQQQPQRKLTAKENENSLGSESSCSPSLYEPGSDIPGQYSITTSSSSSYGSTASLGFDYHQQSWAKGAGRSSSSSSSSSGSFNCPNYANNNNNAKQTMDSKNWAKQSSSNQKKQQNLSPKRFSSDSTPGNNVVPLASKSQSGNLRSKNSNSDSSGMSVDEFVDSYSREAEYDSPPSIREEDRNLRREIVAKGQKSAVKESKMAATPQQKQNIKKSNYPIVRDGVVRARVVAGRSPRESKQFPFNSPPKRRGGGESPKKWGKSPVDGSRSSRAPSRRPPSPRAIAMFRAITEQSATTSENQPMISRRKQTAAPPRPRSPRTVNNPIGERWGSIIFARPKIAGIEQDSTLRYEANRPAARRAAKTNQNDEEENDENEENNEVQRQQQQYNNQNNNFEAERTPPLSPAIQPQQKQQQQQQQKQQFHENSKSGSGESSSSSDPSTLFSQQTESQ